MIPRVTNFSGHRSYADTQVTALKPGQDINRKYYEAVSTTADDPKFLDNHNRFKTVYGQSLVDKLNPDSYVNNPRSAVFDKLGQPIGLKPDPVPARQSAPPTSHWKSTASQAFQQLPTNARAAQRPEWSKHTRPHQVHMPSDFYTRKV